MQKFKLKNPIRFEGMQYTGTNTQAVLESFGDVARLNASPFKPDQITIQGGDAYMIVDPTDWILRDEQGSLYVCPDEYFKENYEPETEG